MSTKVGSRVSRPERDLHLSRQGGVVTDWCERGKNVFFPQAWLDVDGEKKLRGGMHPCFPNFGTVDEKYGLPQHGPLRNTSDLISDEKDEEFVRRFSSKNLLGNFKQSCMVRVSTQPCDRGFVYRLEAQLSSQATESVPISAGLHPYFATPQGIATVTACGKFEVKDLLKKAVVIPLTPVVTVDIPGIGTVEMDMQGSLLAGAVEHNSTSRLVLWRDRLDYLCVEPVLAMGTDFGKPKCPRLKPGKNIVISCAFRLL